MMQMACSARRSSISVASNTLHAFIIWFHLLASAFFLIISNTQKMRKGMHPFHFKIPLKAKKHA